MVLVTTFRKIFLVLITFNTDKAFYKTVIISYGFIRNKFFDNIDNC